MWQHRFDKNILADRFGQSVELAAAQVTGTNLLNDAQVAAPEGQVSAPAVVTPADQKAGVPPSIPAKPDQSATPDASNATKSPAVSPEIKDMLAHAKQLRANVVTPAGVVSIDNLDFTHRPAWNPHVIQKGAVDTTDDLILDRQGNLTVNADKKIVNSDKKSKAANAGIVSIGIEADDVHWSPLFLPLKQEETIRDTIASLRANNPQFHVPAPLDDVPWQCLTPMPAQPGQAAVDPALFQKLLDMSKLTDRIVAAVAGNEGNLATVTTNDAGFGWSVGMRQWNQHVGELPNLLGAMYKKDPCKFVKDFGPYASKIINNVADPAHATVNEDFIRHADFSALLGFTDAKHKHVNHVQDVENALNDFQDVQVALSRQFVNQGIKLAQKYGFTSELGWAEVCDMVNQKGAGGAEFALRHIATADKAKEAVRIRALETAAHRPGGQARLANLTQQFSPVTAGTVGMI